MRINLNNSNGTKTKGFVLFFVLQSICYLFSFNGQAQCSEPSLGASNECSTNTYRLVAISNESNLNGAYHKWYLSSTDAGYADATIDYYDGSYLSTSIIVNDRNNTYWVSLVNGGCESPRKPINASSLNEITTPFIGISPIGGYGLCQGEFIQLEAFPGGANYTLSQFVWYIDGVAQTGETGEIFSVSYDDVFNVSVSARANGTCVSNQLISADISPNIPFFETPYQIPDKLGGDGIICKGETSSKYQAIGLYCEQSTFWSIEGGGESTIDSNGIVTWDQTFLGFVTINLTATSWFGTTDVRSLEVEVVNNDDCFNTITSTSFTAGNIPISSSKSYFDHTGKLIQSQTKSRATNTIFASQPIYDKFNRPAGQTLSAPISTTEFGFEPNFMQESSAGAIYGSENFDKLTPDPVLNTQPGTLGHYYSTNNNLEPYVATTSYPFSKTEYYDDGTGEQKSQSAPGNQFVGNEKRSYSKTFPVLTDLNDHYAWVYDKLLGKTGTSFKFAAVKTVSRGVDGKEVIGYSDESGNGLVSAYGYVAGGVEFPIQYTSTALSGFEGGAFDFHVPQSASGSTSLGVTKSGGGGPPIILASTDLLTGLDVTTSQKPMGFYRCEGAERIEGTYKYYDASFNFYDDMGRLIVSVPPLGVKDILSKNKTQITEQYVKENIPYATYYTYDYQGRLLSMEETDAGITNYVYRKDGSIRFSQNAKQKANGGRYSYTNYDKLGRPVESGEYVGTAIAFQSANMTTILESTEEGGGLITSHSQRKDWVSTYYDLADYAPGATLSYNEQNVSLRKYNASQTEIKAENSVTLLPGFAVASGQSFTASVGTPADVPVPSITLPEQDFLHGAVSYTENENSKTWYSYDEMGRVTWMASWYPHIFDEPKLVEYEYDFLGNVTYVKYQAGEEDAFYHRYEYDLDMRLSKAYASKYPISLANANGSLQAEYVYYTHGPLKKVTLADGIEDIEYYYTLNGQLKSINNPNDNNNTFAQTFYYYQGDYTRGNFSIPTIDQGDSKYNGNISVTRSKTKYAGGSQELIMHYDYDDKNQLVKASNSTNNAFKVDGISYDAHGNIQSIRRKDTDGTSNRHDLAYNYDPNNLNRLNSVADAGDENYDATYGYNEIGEMDQLTRQGKSMETYEYDVAGKVKKITSNELEAVFEYDDRGFRIRKVNEKDTNPENIYVRDASGSIMAIYEANANEGYDVIENPIYGASRLGTYYHTDGRREYELKDHLGNVRAVVGVEATDPITLYQNNSTTTTNSFNFSANGVQEGDEITLSFDAIPSLNWGIAAEIYVNGSSGPFQYKLFEEGSNDPYTDFHTFSFTLKVTKSNVTNTNVLIHDAYGGNMQIKNIKLSRRTVSHAVTSVSNYYPFGLKMKYTGGNIGPAADYRYGYQGDFAEEDDETGFNHFEARQYDPVIGRWMVPDPARQYSSGYIGMGNNPIMGVDPNGEWVWGAGFLNNVRYSDASNEQMMYYSSLYPDANITAGKNGFEISALSHTGETTRSAAYETFVNVNISKSGDVNIGFDSYWHHYPIDAIHSDPLSQLMFIPGAGAAISSSARLVGYGVGRFAGLFATNSSRVFWGGSRFSMLRGMAYARMNNMVTLEMTLAGRTMNAVHSYLPRAVKGPIWEGLSTSFASGARGSANVFLKNQGAGRIWSTIERPILQNRGIGIQYHYGIH